MKFSPKSQYECLYINDHEILTPTKYTQYSFLVTIKSQNMYM